MNWRHFPRRRKSRRQPSKRDTFRILKDKGVPVASVIDVGVLDGTPDLMWAFPDVPHLLIEPVPGIAPKITARYDAAGITHRLVTAAASDTHGEMVLHLKQQDGQDITHARLDAPIEETASGGAITVPARPLDAILGEEPLPAPALLKIDVDGAELQVLEGAGKALEMASIVCIETGVANLFDRAAPILEAGFSLFDIVDLCYYEDRLAQADLVFIRKQLIADLGIELFKGGFDPARWQAL